MKLPHPKIKKASYPNGNAYWLVSCTVGGQRYRKKHDTEQAALQDRVRLTRTASSGLTASEHVSTEQAVYLLKKTANLDARERDVFFAVEWFCEHYTNPFKIKSLRTYLDEFMAIKHAQGRRPDTVRELERILGKFIADFKHANVTLLKFEEIAPWIAANSNGREAEKHVFYIVKHFFGFLTGDSVNTPNPHPILKANPFNGRGVIYQNDEIDDDTGIVIFTAQECESILREAQHYNAQRMFAWLLFTGMRPMEAIRFWTEERWGWNLISKDLKYIRVPKTISKTRRNRVIAVSKTLKTWLECYRSVPSFMTSNWRAKYNWVRKKALPADKLKADIARHTLISMMIKEGKGWAEIELQMGNKKEVQMRHYASLITSLNEVQGFYGLTSEKFEHDIAETEYRNVSLDRQTLSLRRWRENICVVSEAA